MSESDSGNPVPSDALLAQQILDAISITGHLSKSMLDGESPVAWVKRMISERDEARAALVESLRMHRAHLAPYPESMARWRKAAGLDAANPSVVSPAEPAKEKS